MKNKLILTGLFLILLCTIIVQYVIIRNNNQTIDIIVKQRNESLKSNSYLFKATNKSMNLLIYIHKYGVFDKMDSLQKNYIDNEKDTIIQNVNSSVKILRNFK